METVKQHDEKEIYGCPGIKVVPMPLSNVICTSGGGAGGDSGEEDPWS